jgi:hypothetical protein
MKHFSYLMIILFISCNQNKSVNNEESNFFSEGSIHLSQDFKDKFEKEVSDSIIPQNLENQNCIFDQTKQTDDFLKGIKEFEGYVWNPETKIAIIKLSETETLEIFRGGCAHFSLSATFTFNNKMLSFKKDKEFIIRKSLWISKLITEFHFEELSNNLESNSYIIEDYENNSTQIYFTNKYLANNHYSIWISNNTTNSKIEIGFYIN